MKGGGGARGRGLCATARLCRLCRLCWLWRVAGGGACEAGEDVAQVNVLEGGRELPLLRDVPAREGEGERVLTRACPRSGVRGKPRVSSQHVTQPEGFLAGGAGEAGAQRCQLVKQVDCE